MKREISGGRVYGSFVAQIFDDIFLTFTLKTSKKSWSTVIGHTNYYTIYTSFFVEWCRK